MDNTASINEEQKLIQQQKIIIAEKQPQQNISTDKELQQSNDLSITTNQTIQKTLDILFKEEYTGSLANELQTELKRRKRKRLRPE